MIRTATVTWVKFFNFGSYLQAYALQQILLQHGYDNDILNDVQIQSERLEKRHFRSLRMKMSSLKDFLKNRNYFKAKKIINQKYIVFAEKYLKINSKILPLSLLNQQYDVFICGSDQIWHPSLDVFSPYYYLEFATKKKIAYAPSIGTFDYPEEFIPKVRPLLDRFDRISVREEQGAEILSAFMNKEIQVVLDPTLLLERQSWEILIKDKPLKREKYILCYFLTPNSWYLDYVRNFAVQKQLSIKIFGTHSSYLKWDECILAGPEDFLDYIYNSEYFFTDSFHGSIFSILFEKRFYTFQRFENTERHNQNSRIVHLFSLLGLEEYLIKQTELDKIEILSPINYEQVKEKLDVYRKESLCYLLNALKN